MKSENEKTIRVSVKGTISYFNEILDVISRRTETITHCCVDTVDEAVKAVSRAYVSSNWNVQDENGCWDYVQAQDFYPLSVTVSNAEGHILLKGSLVGGVDWEPSYITTLVTLAKLEGELMVLSSFDKLGLSREKLEDWDEASDAARTVSGMVAHGQITTEASYQLACSLEKLTSDIWDGVWEAYFPAGLPSLTELQEKSCILQEKEAQLIANQKKAFRVNVDGLMVYRDEDDSGKYETREMITHCYVDTLNEAIAAVRSAYDTDTWNIRDENKNYLVGDYNSEPLDFIPSSVAICDIEGRVHLKADLTDDTSLNLQIVENDDINTKKEIMNVCEIDKSDLTESQFFDTYSFLQSNGVSTGSIESIDIDGAQEFTRYTEGPDSYSIFIKDGHPVAASDNMNLLHRVMGEYLEKSNRQKLSESDEKMVSHVSLKDLGRQLETLIIPENQMKNTRNLLQQERSSTSLDDSAVNKIRNR